MSINIWAIFPLILLLAACETTPDALPSIQWTAYGSTQTLQQPIVIPAGTTYDGKLSGGKKERYRGKGNRYKGDQSENQLPLFILEPGAQLRNVIIDAPAGDGVHIRAGNGKTNKLIGVEFRDVGEDAVTVETGSHGDLVLIKDCTFAKAKDKIVQINAPATVQIQECQAEDFGRFARTNGTPGAPDHPYRVSIRDGTFSNGDAVLKMSNSRARGEIIRGRFFNISNIAQASGGARIEITK